MGTPEALDLAAIDLLGAGPALGGAQHDHGPVAAGRLAGAARLVLEGADLRVAGVHGRRHLLMHGHRVVALDEVGRPPVAAHQLRQLLLGDAREQRRVVDLVAVEMKDRQHRPVADGVQELAGVPGGGQGPGLGLAVTDRDRHQEVRVVEGGPEGVGDGVAELAALVDGAGGLRRAVGADAAGEGELLEEGLHALLVLALVGVDLRVGAFQIDRGQHAGCAVAGAREEDRLLLVGVDDPVEVHVHERQAGARAPVAEEPLLDVRFLEGLAQQRIVEQIDHARREIVAGAPVGVDLGQHVGGEWSSRRRLPRAGQTWLFSSIGGVGD